MLSLFAAILPFLMAASGAEIGVLIAEGVFVVGAGATIGVLENKIRKKSKSDDNAEQSDDALPEEEQLEEIAADEAPADETEPQEEQSEKIAADEAPADETEPQEDQSEEIAADETPVEEAAEEEQAEETETQEVREEELEGREDQTAETETREEQIEEAETQEERFDSDAAELKAFVAARAAECSEEEEADEEDDLSPDFDEYESVEQSDKRGDEAFEQYGSKDSNELRRHIHESMAATRIASQNVEKYDWDRIKEYNTAIMPIATFGGSEKEEDDDDEKPGGGLIADDIIFSSGDDVMNVRYRKGFKAKLIQSDDIVKDYYLIVRAALMHYKKVRVQECFARENYYAGRGAVAKLALRGKTLIAYLAIDPTTLEGTKYRFRNLAEVKQYAKTPVMIRITSTRSARWACELIDMMMKDQKVIADYQPDHSPIPFERTSSLLKRRLVRTYTPDGSIELTDYMLEQLEKLEGNGKTGSAYRQSFAAKIIRSDKTLQGHYSEIKNELLSYKNVKVRSSWSVESFYQGRITKAKLALRGKTLTLFLALDPEEYVGTKYHAKDYSATKKYAATPVAVKIKSPRGLKFASELVAIAFADSEKLEREKVDYTSEFKDTGALLREGLVKRK